MTINKKLKIAIIGLGYVGSPLFIEFSKYFDTYGYDISKKKINNLNKNSNITLKKNKTTNSIEHIKNCNVYIVCVPTPVLKNKSPNLKPLENACKKIAKILKKNDLVIFESTVYPGATDDFCIPIIERISLLKLNIDFFCGYSPERINPGDNINTLTNIKKITSGSNSKSLKIVNYLYKKIINAGIYPAKSIKIAEAAKVIENTQRDINIAFINELNKIFTKMNIPIYDVLAAASTKWNFLNFKPGLVGGHCIGVDPYYLSFISKKNNFNPKIILSGRETNDSMAKFYVNKIKKILNIKNINIKKTLIMGLAFKENIDDFRNSKVFDMFNPVLKFSNSLDVYDPYISNINKFNYKNIDYVNYPKKNYYDLIIITVAHDKFFNIGSKKIKQFGKRNVKIFDLKNIFYKDKDFIPL